MSNEPLVVEKLYNASADAVWKAITDKDEMRQWYFQLEDFKPETGFKFSFLAGPDDGEKFLHLCEVTEVVSGKKITYSWRYDGYPGESYVTWELEPLGDQTKLTLTHRGIESMAANGPDFAKSSFNQGWTCFLHDAIAKYFENK